MSWGLVGSGLRCSPFNLKCVINRSTGAASDDEESIEILSLLLICNSSICCNSFPKSSYKHLCHGEGDIRLLNLLFAHWVANFCAESDGRLCWHWATWMEGLMDRCYPRFIHHFYGTCRPQKLVLVNYFYLLNKQAAEETHSVSPAPSSVLSETWLGSWLLCYVAFPLASAVLRGQTYPASEGKDIFPSIIRANKPWHPITLMVWLYLRMDRQAAKDLPLLCCCVPVHDQYLLPNWRNFCQVLFWIDNSELSRLMVPTCSRNHLFVMRRLWRNGWIFI